MKVVAYVDESLEAHTRALLDAVLQQSDAPLLARILFEETCLHGHLRTPENDSRWQERPWIRTCRPCKAENNRRYSRGSSRATTIEVTYDSASHPQNSHQVSDHAPPHT